MNVAVDKQSSVLSLSRQLNDLQFSLVRNSESAAEQRSRGGRGEESAESSAEQCS